MPPTAETPTDLPRIELRSDNAAAVAPEIMESIVEANTGSALGYGGDDVSADLTAKIREVFEHPEAEVFCVASGTAANALGLSALVPPWGSVVCHETAHILVNEPGSTTLFSAGAVLQSVGGADGKVDPDVLQAFLDGANWGDPHASQPSALSLTVPSDLGTVLDPDEIGRLTSLARARGLRCHLDGARFANAVAGLGVTPAAMSWQAGIDVLSLGAIKNGAMSTDAIVCFDPELADGFRYRTKRAGHTASKMRFQSVQLLRYLTDGLWLELAGRANAAMARLTAGLTLGGLPAMFPVDANMAFFEVPDETATAMAEAGLDFYRIRPGVIRFVTSFATTFDEVDRAIAIVGEVAGDVA
ncbi:MAG: threonine aldolase family protein [Acidimicrobiales bacterium]